MSRIAGKFNQLKDEGKKALITFVTAGDPDIETTKKLVQEMEARGSDIIELGIPYSDPIAEGPVIQAANARAMKNGLRISDIFNAVADMRKIVEVPLVFLLYYNCIFQYGPDKFFADCLRSGVDGVIIPDLPYEERDEISDIALKYDVDIISMIAPTSKQRMNKIAADAKGFLYCVSSLGVTGVRSDFNTDFDAFFKEINQYKKIPTAIGFGISTADHVRKLKEYSDGIIIGSAIVKLVGASSDGQEAVERVGGFVSTMRTALDL